MLDWNGMERRLGKALAVRYGTSLLAEMPRRLEEAHEAMAHEDLSCLERVAHSLKGMCANLGAEVARAAALAVETAARSGERELLPHRMARMAQEISGLLGALEQNVQRARQPQEEEDMHILVAEDDFSARLILQRMLKEYGTVDVTVDGREAVEAFRAALDAGTPYSVVCLDIMMPEMDGMEALRQMRAIESQHGIRSTQGAKIIMTTALDDPKNVVEAFKGLCDTYLVKPIDKEALHLALVRVGVI